jgi:lysine 6-dehydrogenase
MRMLVLGAGQQGTACAYDLLTRSDYEVVIADIDVGRLPDLLRPYLGGRLTALRLDASDPLAVRRGLVGIDATMSALPYYFNMTLAAAAIEAGSHFCDLGGNTDIVRGQKQLAERARARGLSIVPDCGLAPGMVNILAEHEIRRMDEPRTVRIMVGGLPQHPDPPLNYQVVYSLEGVLDYYTTPSWVLRDGEPVQVEPLSELEQLEIAGVGQLEAFHTAGGLSLMAQRYRGRISTMEYKTLRYPGTRTPCA